MKFINIVKQQLTSSVVSITSNAFYNSDYAEVVETVDIAALQEAIKIPPLEIRITTKKYLTEILLRTITPSYLRGSKITINGMSCKQVTSNPQYFFNWTTQIPSHLPQHLKNAYRNYQLRGALYQELVDWNQSRINLAKRASEFKWEIAEEWYKNLYKYFTPQLRVMSPNKKTFFEATAELDVETWCPVSATLTLEEQSFLVNADSKNYTRAFGLQEVTFQIGSHHRTTPHGTTYEPMLINSTTIKAQMTANYFRQKNDSQDDSNAYTDDTGFTVQHRNSTLSSTVISHTKERENIETLKYFLSLPIADQKEFLLPGWHFCPKCGCAVHEAMEFCEICDSANPDFRELIPYNDDTHDNTEEDDSYMD